MTERKKPGRIRQAVRKFARQENLVGFACSMLLCLVQEGPRETWIRVRRKLGSRYAEQRFIRQMEMNPAEKQAQKETKFPRDILFSFVVPLYNTPEKFLEEMIDSVREQTYGNWELCLADGSDEKHDYVARRCKKYGSEDPRVRYTHLEHNGGISENTNAALAMARGEYIVLLDHDDVLMPSALYEVMKAICRTGADFLYSDEFVFVSPNMKKLVATHFKPDFAPDNLMCNNYICHMTVFLRELTARTGNFRKEYDGSQDHDLVLRLTDAAERIVHIPKVLYFWRSHSKSVASDISTKTYAVDAGIRAVRDFLRNNRGIDAQVSSSPAYPTMYRIQYPIREKPLISMILDPVGMDGKGGMSGNNPSVQELTDYPSVELVRADRGDTRPQRLNEAARRAKGEYLVFLDGGLKPAEKSWMTELLMYAQREDVGAVGGRLLFEDGTVRHAGIIIGLGRHRAAGRGHYRVSGSSSGYFGQMAIVEDVSAVSAECMMISARHFAEIGGFSEAYSTALTDVDLCLRLREKGYLNVYTPYAEMTGGSGKAIRLEIGAGNREYPRDAERFKTRWEKVLAAGDPYYNPNLTLDMTDYRINI